MKIKINKHEVFAMNKQNKQAKLNRSFIFTFFTVLAVGASSQPLVADDTDVFFKVNDENTANNKPNIMFIVDDSESMNAQGQFVFDEPDDCQTEMGNVGTDNNKKVNAVKSCYESEKIYGDKKTNCYLSDKWYYIPNANLSKTMAAPICSDGWGGIGAGNTDIASAYDIRSDRPIDPATGLNKTACSDLNSSIEQTGAKIGWFTGLYTQRCPTTGAGIKDSENNLCSGLGPGTSEYGWYPLDVPVRDSRYIQSGIGGLLNSSKIVAIECLDDIDREHGDPNDKQKIYPNVLDNSVMTPVKTDAAGLAKVAWSSDKNTFDKSAYLYGGIYSGNYLNYLRANTKKEKRQRQQIFKQALKRYVLNSSNIRLGLASFKKRDAIVGETALLNGGEGQGAGGDIDVPIVDIDTIHESWRWVPSYTANRDDVYGGAGGDMTHANNRMWNRDVSHREWLWTQVNEYFGTFGGVSPVDPSKPANLRADLAGWYAADVKGLPRKTYMHRFPDPFLWIAKLNEVASVYTEYASLAVRGINQTSLYRPLGQLLFEVGRYFKSETPKFGVYSRPEAWTPIAKWGGKLSEGSRLQRAFDKPPVLVDRVKDGLGYWYWFRGADATRLYTYRKSEAYSFPLWIDHWWGNGDINTNTTVKYNSPIRGVEDSEHNKNADPCEANIAVIFTDYTGERRGLCSYDTDEQKGNTDDEACGMGVAFSKEANNNPKVNGVLPPYGDNKPSLIASMQNAWGNDLDCTADLNEYGTCLPAIAEYLATHDLSETVNGPQVLRTFVVSYWNDNMFGGPEPKGAAMLRETAKRGKGKFIRFGASLAELDAAINEIMSVSALNPIGAGTFVAPAASIDLSNRLENKNEVYFSLFEPSETDRWKGNVKRYQIVNSEGTPKIVGADCDVSKHAACNPDTVITDINTFKPSARSGWAQEAKASLIKDGDKVSEAGVKLAAAKDRSIYTDYCSTGIGVNTVLGTVNDDCFDISKLNTADKIVEFAKKIGISTPNTSTTNNSTVTTTNHSYIKLQIQNKLNYFQGYSGKYNASGAKNERDDKYIGDPLHSQPKIVNLENGLSVIFFGTNEGYVHAVNANNGEEIFAFLPESALKAASRYDSDEPKSGAKIYGVDGEIETWVNDTNGNGIADGDESIYIFFGMRRGGSNYYALDVSDLKNYAKNNAYKVTVKMPWQIKPASKQELQSAKITADPQSFFENKDAGSWVKPSVIKTKFIVGRVKNSSGAELKSKSGKNLSDKTIHIAGKTRFIPRERAVVVLTAGYDQSQDDSHDRKTDYAGRAIYLLDAETGARLWAAGYPDGDYKNAYNETSKDMRFSFAATPAVFDIDGDGFIDTIIAVDTGGQIWRVNLNAQEKVEEQIGNDTKVSYYMTKPSLELVAKLASDDDKKNDRKFFNTPDLMFDRTDRSLLVVIGSGRRPNPLQNYVNNRLYAIKIRVADKYVPKNDIPKIDVPSKSGGTVKVDKPGYSEIITEEVLFDASDANALAAVRKSEKDANLAAANNKKLDYFNKNGFYFKLGERNSDGTKEQRTCKKRVDCINPGEKIITNASIFNNTIIFTSYLPSKVPEFCGAALGDNRFNAINIANPDSRISVSLAQHGIAPKPAVLLLKDANGERKPAIVVGTEVVKPSELGKMESLKSLYTLSRDKLIKMWLER